jgi:hypothetical protein
MTCSVSLPTATGPDKHQHPLVIHQHDLTSDCAFPVPLSGSTTARGTGVCQPAPRLRLATLQLLLQTWGRDWLGKEADAAMTGQRTRDHSTHLIPCDGPFIWIDQGPSERTPVLLFSSAGMALQSDPSIICDCDSPSTS